MRRYKSNVHNGGACTPAIMHWPKGLKTKPGSITEQRGHVIDMLATCIDLAGSSYPKKFGDNNIDSPKMPYVKKFHDFYIRDDFDGFIDYAYEQKAIKEFHAGYYDTNLSRVTVRGRVEIDKFFKVEDMQECLFQLQMKLGFESRKGFDDWRKNSSAEYKKKKSYKDYYSTYSKDYIEKHFAEDLNYFNYGF